MKLTQITKIGSALIVSVALIASAKALPSITGDINFDGVATTNTGNLATATSFTTITGVSVVPVEDGTYTGTTGAGATFTPFSFTAAAVTPLWTFTWGGITYSFDATSITIVTQKKGFLNLQGWGWANATGYASTEGSWSITDTGTKSTVTFGSAATVPDSGATALLIGLGLAGIAAGLVAQRKLARS
jgi:roadblock/LC7 domain-containing protein